MTNQQPALIRQLNTWMTFIGQRYTDEKFIREAQRDGVSRRVPAKLARAMNFGERVICLRWGGSGKVSAFAEFTITSLSLDHSLSQKLGEKLKEQGRANYSDGGGAVQRECGAYFVVGSWRVAEDVTLREIIDLAQEIADSWTNGHGEKITYLIGGALTQVYSVPVLLDPAPKFTRGFTKCPADASFEFVGQAVVPDKQLVCLKDYQAA